MKSDTVLGNIPSRWGIEPLGKYAEVIDPHPSHRAPAEVNDGYPFLGIGDIDYFGNATFSEARQVSLSVIEDHERNYCISDETIGYAKMGNTIGKIVSFPKRSSEFRFAISPALSIINPKNNINPYYLRAVIESRSFWGQVNGKITGSTRPSIGIQQLRSILIPIPTIKEEDYIGEVWKKLYEKMLLNNKINDNLQEQAIAIYSNMIIDNADGSWTTGVLSDIAEITMGQSPKGDTYNEDGIGTVFFQGRAEFGFRFPARRLFTTDPKRMAQANDALMSVRAPVGDINVAYEDCCIGRGLSSIRSKDSHQSFVLYTMLALREELNVFNGEGTVFGSINRDALNSIPSMRNLTHSLKECLPRKDCWIS